MSSSNTAHNNTNPDLNVNGGCGVRAPLRTTLTDENVGRRFLGCVKLQGYKKCKFFEWVDPERLKPVMDFGNWIVRKKMELEKNIEELHKQMKEIDFGFRVKMINLQKREEWFLLEMNCMKEKMNDMEAKFALKMEEWKNKQDWHGLKMEEVVEKIEALKLKMEEVVARNDILVKRNKALQEEVKLAKLMVVVLIAMVVVLVGIRIVLLCGQGMWKKKMLALPYFNVFFNLFKLLFFVKGFGECGILL